MSPRRRTPTREERLAAVGFDLGRLPLEEIEACDLCGGSFFIQVARRDRYGIPLATQLCAACGLVFLSPRPTAEGYAELYERWYRPLVEAFGGRAADPAALEPGQRAYAEQLDAGPLGRALRRRGRGGRLLDVGGSTGVVAAYFAERYGFEAVCLDPSPHEAERARARGLETFVGMAEDFDPGDRRFDVVLVCQTVDHLLSVRDVLRRAHGWLEEDGLFFIDPVDFRAVARAAHSLVTTLKIDHPFYLTRETMDLYLARAGFATSALDASGNVFHVDYVCRKVEPRPDASVDGPFAAALYAEIRWLQATHALGHRPSNPESWRRRLRRLFRS